MTLATTATPIRRVTLEGASEKSDFLAIEEPLEIRLGWDSPGGKRHQKTVSITMRTPGQDRELALGFLFTEGILHELSNIDEIKPCGPMIKGTPFQNVIRVELKAGVPVEFQKLERHFYTSSSCGVCGKTSIEALQSQRRFQCSDRGPYFGASQIHHFPSLLRASQGIFDQTGGLHASGLFSQTSELVLVHEDVGRHNALDKLVGNAWIKQMLPLKDQMLIVSGRVSFELVQKASMAGISIMGAVGAPSSLAVELAREVNMTLLGFMRDQRFNIYNGQWRIYEAES